MSPEHRLINALIARLYREDILDHKDLAAIADEVGSATEEDARAAHLVRCIIIEALAPPKEEWEAERRRARFRVIEGDE